MKLKTGKISPKDLEKYVFKLVNYSEKTLLVPPGIGMDAAAVYLEGETLVITTDPITGGEKRIGWLSVHVNANDIAVMGAEPKWFLVSLLLPPRSNSKRIGEIMKEIKKALGEVGATLVGGHTEVTPGIRQPIVVATMMGVAHGNKLTPSSNCREGDYLLMTKTAGIEGTAILATDFYEELQDKVSRETLKNAQRFAEKISVVKEAVLIREYANAMHDPTEGGLVNGLWEMAVASGKGVRVQGSRIPIAKETDEICSILGLDPLKLISSGSLLASVPPENIKTVMERLKIKNVRGTIIGRVTRDPGQKLIFLNGEWKKLCSVRDELWRFLEDKEK